MRGTIELRTERLLLRRHHTGDAKILHEEFGCDPKMFEYSGWNPYETAEMAENTVREFIASYDDPRFYGWAIDLNGQLVGTIGAYDYDYEIGQIEVGMSIKRDCWGKGFAGEALTAVIHYLSEQEGIRNVTAWCASDNIGSMKVMKKAGMILTEKQTGALEISGERYDKLIFNTDI